MSNPPAPDPQPASPPPSGPSGTPGAGLVGCWVLLSLIAYGVCWCAGLTVPRWLFYADMAFTALLGIVAALLAWGSRRP